MNQPITWQVALIIAAAVAEITGVVIVNVKAARQNRINDTLPVETARAEVKSKTRFEFADLFRKRGGRTPLMYHITFETEKGDMKFDIDRGLYAAHNLKAMQKGDAGYLSYQGTRYIGFMLEQYWGGAYAAPRFCVNCGTPLNAAANFCTGCGTQTATAGVKSAAAQRQPYR